MTKSLRPKKGISESWVEYSLGQRQLPLFPSPTNVNGSAGFRDPAFSDNKNLPIHRWVPWIAGYSASFVDDAIFTFLPNRKSALVLDPFCGVGTTVFQAVYRGFDAIGYEINPYPALATDAKLSAFRIDLAKIDAELALMQKDSIHWRTAPVPPGIFSPPLKSRIPFFSPVVENQVLHALAFINNISSKAIHRLFLTAFGAVMVSFSNYSYEPSLGTRTSAGKPLVEDADVGRVLLSKLHQMRADIDWLQQEISEREQFTGRVINNDFFDGDTQLEEGTVDLMVTSPPYMNNYHYVRNTRPQLYWLDFISSPSEQKYLEIHNFGQYWQTVRDAKPLDLAFKHPRLEKIIHQLRQTREEKKAYGGPGWANYVTAYFNDSFRFMGELKRVLARGGVGVIVIGNSIIQGINIDTENLLGEIGEMHGLSLEGVYCVREKRVGASITQSSVRHGKQNRATLSESAVVVRKA